MKKIRTGTMLYPKIIKLADNNLSKANVFSRNDFIEKSIIFYSGFLNSEDNIEYMNEVLNQTIVSQINSLEENLSSLLFKLSVELNMTMNVLAIYFDIDEDSYNILRKKSIKQVKETIGKLNLGEILKVSKEEE